MNTHYITNPKLNIQLQKLGVESQFIVWRCTQCEKIYTNCHFGRSGCKSKEAHSLKNTVGEMAYHFSDLLLIKNTSKVWPNGIGGDKVLEFISLVMHGNDWQSWLQSELDKLNK